MKTALEIAKAWINTPITNMLHTEAKETKILAEEVVRLQDVINNWNFGLTVKDMALKEAEELFREHRCEGCSTSEFDGWLAKHSTDAS